MTHLYEAHYIFYFNGICVFRLLLFDHKDDKCTISVPLKWTKGSHPRTKVPTQDIVSWVGTPSVEEPEFGGSITIGQSPPHSDTLD